jgi:hypothetical protein
MRTDLSIDRARSVLRELAAARLPALTFDLRELRLTETGALRFPTGIATLSDHARHTARRLARHERSSRSRATAMDPRHGAHERTPRFGDRPRVPAARAGRRRHGRARDRGDPSPGRRRGAPRRRARLLDDASGYGIEQGGSHTTLVARTGRRFDAGGHGTSTASPSRSTSAGPCSRSQPSSFPMRAFPRST